jgi:hypothetical protein
MGFGPRLLTRWGKCFDMPKGQREQTGDRSGVCRHTPRSATNAGLTRAAVRISPDACPPGALATTRPIASAGAEATVSRP